MRKSIYAAVIIFLMSNMVFAYGNGVNSGNPAFTKNQNYFYGCQRAARFNGNMSGANFINLSKENASKTLTEFVKNNLKGYTIINIDGLVTPRGTIYFANVKDSSGNIFQIKINRFGNVMGPFLVKN
jgi:hypothetical protein